MHKNKGRELFGTDGIRGVANQYPMTPGLVVSIGQAMAAYVQQRSSQSHRCRILIGKDTRLSGYMFESSLSAGITSMGVNVQLVGPLPTPAISMLTTGMRADAGVVISASHNPYRDNGIKIFGRDGFKLSDKQEARIEADVFDDDLELAPSQSIGKAIRIEDARGRYVAFLKNAFPKELSLDGMRVVIDCANGAAYRVAPEVLEELGADVVAIGDEPDGRNINDECGSLYPERAARLVRKHEADVGVTLDGDADRVIFIDETGNEIAGEQILALCAEHLSRRNQLRADTLVTTVMSNMGLDDALRRRGISVVRTQVGDRYVVDRMREEDLNFGGEESGHLIFLEHATTGDGMIAALQVLAIMQRRAEPLSELADMVDYYPKALVNVEVESKPPLDSIDGFREAADQIERQLGQHGRLLVRYSGTQPKVRVLVECRDRDEAQSRADELAKVLNEKIGRNPS